MGNTNKIKILFFIPVWKRLDVTAICYKGLQRIIEHGKDRANIDVLIVYSEEEHKALAQRHGFKIFHADNFPVGSKLNNGMEYALTMPWDYVFQLNSDDLLSNELFDIYFEQMQAGANFVSVCNIIPYDVATGRAMKYEYTLNGCGIRAISRDWIEKGGYMQYCSVSRTARGPWMSYSAGTNQYLSVALTRKQFIQALSAKKVFRLWPPEANKGLDNASRDVLFGAFGEPVAWIRTSKNPLVIDIKTDVNIWPYDSLGYGKELSEDERSRLPRYFPEMDEVVSLRMFDDNI